MNQIGEVVHEKYMVENLSLLWAKEAAKMPERFQKKTFIARTPKEVFDWHMEDGAFLRLMPPWEDTSLVSCDTPIKNGSRAILEVGMGPLKLEWVAEHCDVESGKGFTDVQVRGPFKSWKHRHEFIAAEGGCILEDSIEYELPGGALSEIASQAVRRKLEAMFTYRHDITKSDLTRDGENRENKSMKILISGSSGLVGSSLVPYLTTKGHEVVRLKRTPKGESNEVCWSPGAAELAPEDVEGFDAVIHLAGENIASGRWTEEKKKELRDSRIDSTRLLVDTFKKLQNPPSIFICASAIGFYGDRGDDTLTEESSAGDNFLAELCKDWEKEASRADELGIRRVSLRIGVVMSPRGGMLAKVLPPFQMGTGGNIGSGKQYMSWIAVDDLVGVIDHALNCQELSGPVNSVAPQPVTNESFTKSLGKVLGRPTIFPVPGFVAKLAFGEMAEELMLASARVMPEKLEKTGFKFQYPDIESALRHLLGKSK